MHRRPTEGPAGSRRDEVGKAQALVLELAVKPVGFGVEGAGEIVNPDCGVDDDHIGLVALRPRRDWLRSPCHWILPRSWRMEVWEWVWTRRRRAVSTTALLVGAAAWLDEAECRRFRCWCAWACSSCVRIAQFCVRRTRWGFRLGWFAVLRRADQSLRLRQHSGLRQRGTYLSDGEAVARVGQPGL